MKTQKWIKMAVLTLAITTIGYFANAQQVGSDVTKQATTTLGAYTSVTTPSTDYTATTTPIASVTPVDAGYVRVIDNKGTIKFLQVKNGLTQVTNATADKGIVTTWQLGGTFTDDTKLDLNGHTFVLDNVLQVDPTNTTTGVPATATTAKIGGGHTGWTLIVRDEATGQLKKLRAADLIVSGQTVFKATAGIYKYTVAVLASTQASGSLTNGGSGSVTAAGILLPTFEKVFVFRNGAKLLAGVDYTISGSDVNIVKSTSTANEQDFDLYDGDIIEVQYSK